MELNSNAQLVLRPLSKKYGVKLCHANSLGTAKKSDMVADYEKFVTDLTCILNDCAAL